MPEARTLGAAATAIVLAGCLTACGDHSSSASASSSSASKADFCRTFDQLGSQTTPQRAADELARVGTPSDIGSSALRGFDVLIAHLRDLPPGTQPRQVTQMVQGLHSQDATDVRAFITYYASACQGLPGDPSS
jgi:hypothetical protein